TAPSGGFAVPQPKNRVFTFADIPGLFLGYALLPNWPTTVSAMNSWGFYALTFRFSTDLCFMFILSFYHFRPNCL
ncbi:hypothetical protein POV26_04570, partial [Aequorivita todarodis]|uniref:hypothetical protein n=1 Tax=Aequorivita todarodis TaxID=2036821 RepID=UPI002350D992